MSKKIAYYLLIILFSCNKMPDSKGDSNDLLVVTSKEDKDFIFPYINEIIYSTINTPIEENIYNVKWIDASDFFNYKHYKNIFLISLENPVDSTADFLIDKIADSKNNNLIAIDNVFANDQLVVVLNAFDSIHLKEILDKNRGWITNTINDKVLDRFFTINNLNDFNDAIIDTIKLKFDLSLNIDENYKILKNDENFIWIGRGYPYRWLMINYINKDSKNIFDLFIKSIEDNGKNVVISDYFKSIEYNSNYIKLSGLYEHKESETGGPFIAYCYDDDLFKDQYYCISGYVNNPGKSKYNLLKQLESVIINNRKVSNGI